MESNKIADDLCLLVPLIDVSSLAKSFPRKDRLSVWSNLSFRRKNKARWSKSTIAFLGRRSYSCDHLYMITSVYFSPFISRHSHSRLEGLYLNRIWILNCSFRKFGQFKNRWLCTAVIEKQYLSKAKIRSLILIHCNAKLEADVFVCPCVVHGRC